MLASRGVKEVHEDCHSPDHDSDNDDDEEEEEEKEKKEKEEKEKEEDDTTLRCRKGAKATLPSAGDAQSRNIPEILKDERLCKWASRRCKEVGDGRCTHN
ncbi:hypothetical protein E2C01_044618 [Portunus trituberculatus]|uniref:Uncharacterized protein n=1 Tax=Portunus trituberculatus TaxID=210409 RepID=A0A5B7G2T6_PORTR|nr:hypothetical protein [Portunus trituberculatus]